MIEMTKKTAEETEKISSHQTAPLNQQIVPPKIITILLTGGPCGGKSSALTYLQNSAEQKGYDVLVLPETATLVFETGVAKLINTENKKLTFNIQKGIIDMQIQMENSIKSIAQQTNKNTVIIMDRGSMDGKAFTSEEDWKKLLTVLDPNKSQDEKEKEWLMQYDAIIHMETCANAEETAIYYKNGKTKDDTGKSVNRITSKEEAPKADTQCYKIYEMHTKHIRINNGEGRNFESQQQRFNDKLKRVEKAMLDTIQSKMNEKTGTTRIQNQTNKKVTRKKKQREQEVQAKAKKKKEQEQNIVINKSTTEKVKQKKYKVIQKETVAILLTLLVVLLIPSTLQLIQPTLAMFIIQSLTTSKNNATLFRTWADPQERRVTQTWQYYNNTMKIITIGIIFKLIMIMMLPIKIIVRGTKLIINHKIQIHEKILQIARILVPPLLQCTDIEVQGILLIQKIDNYYIAKQQEQTILPTPQHPRIKIHHLKSNEGTKMNGLKGNVIKWSTRQQRYLIALDSGQKVALKATNIYIQTGKIRETIIVNKKKMKKNKYVLQYTSTKVLKWLLWILILFLLLNTGYAVKRKDRPQRSNEARKIKRAKQYEAERDKPNQNNNKKRNRMEQPKNQNQNKKIKNKKSQPEIETLNIWTQNCGDLVKDDTNQSTLKKQVKRYQLATDMKKHKINITLMQGTKSKGYACNEIKGYEGYFWILEQGCDGTRNGVAMILDKKAYNAWKRAKSKVYTYGDNSDKVAVGEISNVGRWLAIDLEFTDAKKKKVLFTIASAYSPTSNHYNMQKKFLKGFDNIKKQARNKILIIGGDLNAAVGVAKDNKSDNVVGKYGIPTRNTAGRQLYDKLNELDMVIQTTRYEHKDQHKGGTWKHVANDQWYQNDHIICLQKDTKRFNYARTMDATTASTVGDHRGVEAQIKIAANVQSQRKPTRKTITKPTTAQYKSAEGKAAYYKAAAATIKKMQQQGKDTYTLKAIMETNKIATQAMKTVMQQRTKTWMDFERTELDLKFKQLDNAIRNKNIAKDKKTSTEEMRKLELAVQTAEEQMEGSRKKSIGKWRNHYTKELEKARMEVGIEGAAQKVADIEKILRNKKKNKQNKTYMHLNNEQGDRCTTDEEVAEQVRNYMIQLVGTNYQGTDMSYVKTCLNNKDVKLPTWNENIFRTITEEDVRKVISKGKLGKANTGASMDAMRVLTDWKQHNYAAAIATILNKHISKEDVQEEINNVEMTGLKKKPNAKTANKYRWICVCHIAQKIMDLIFVDRIEKLVHNQIDVSQCGFMKQREGLDVSMTINRIVDTRRQQNKKTFILFADVIGAFPRMSREVMNEALVAFGFPTQGMKWIDAMYNKPIAKASPNGVDVKVETTAGGIQGAVATPLLYIITKYMCDRSFAFKFPQHAKLKLVVPDGSAFMSPRSKETTMDIATTESVMISAVTYADDEASITLTEEQMREQAEDMTIHNQKFGQQTHKNKKQNKTKVMVVHGIKQNKDDIDTKKSVKITKMYDDDEEGEYKYTTSMTHIGILFEDNWSFINHRKKKIHLANQEWKNSRHILQNAAVDIDTKMAVYTRYILPHLLHGSELYPLSTILPIIKFHDRCIREMYGYKTVQDMENEGEDQNDVRIQMGDISMETHLQKRLLQWVGRAIRKKKLGYYALKGVLNVDNTSKINIKPTATDIRISEALKAMGTTMEAIYKIQNIHITQQINNKKTTCVIQKSPKEVQDMCNSGHKDVEQTTKRKTKCRVCMAKGNFKIQREGTIHAYSALHKHFLTCTGFKEKIEQKTKDIILHLGGPLRCRNCNGISERRRRDAGYYRQCGTCQQINTWTQQEIQNIQEYGSPHNERDDQKGLAKYILEMRTKYEIETVRRKAIDGTQKYKSANYQDIELQTKEQAKQVQKVQIQCSRAVDTWETLATSPSYWKKMLNMMEYQDD